MRGRASRAVRSQAEPGNEYDAHAWRDKHVGKIWASLFLLMLVFGVLSFVVAPYYDHWLPRDISETGWAIDHLFMFILWLTGVCFIATELVLFWFLWKYNANDNPQP